MTARCLLILSGLLVGCGDYDSPPRMFLPEAVDGVMSNPTAPLVVGFHEPIDFDSLSLKVVRFDPNNEGLLADEDDDPATELEIIYQHTSPLDSDVGGLGTLDATGVQFGINLFTTLPIGPRLAVIVEPGLKDTAGNEWKVRQVSVFGFEFECSEGTPSATFPSGTYFFLVKVDEPVSTQIQLFADIRVDNEHGVYVGQFTNADRREDLDCGMACEDGKICATLPEPRCVLPSEDMQTPFEFSNYFPNTTPPEGYTFTIKGCVRDLEDGLVAFGNQPADVVVQSPPVIVKGINFNAAFGPNDTGDYVGEGTFVAEQVFLGDTPSGVGVGTHLDLLIPSEEVPDGVPAPPFGPEAILDEFASEDAD